MHNMTVHHTRKRHKPGQGFRTSNSTITRQAAKNLILQRKCSYYDVALVYDMNESQVIHVLFDRNPKPEQIELALKTYDAGFPLKEACVMHAVSELKMKEVLRDRKLGKGIKNEIKHINPSAKPNSRRWPTNVLHAAG